ncbi:MAG: glutathione S-transferase N-terminal domain-containing protein, partial [Gammaproteobacteria bacterium]
MIVYGASVSYYTGKLEAYLRYKGISYERASPYPQAERIKREAGCIQHPVVERQDGRWMSDTTPIILQLEQEHPNLPVLPQDPVVRFIALLIEDYADEWLWRAAM